MASVDDLVSHVVDCEAVASQRRFLSVTVTTPRYNEASPLRSTIKVATRTDITEYGARTFVVERSWAAFVELQETLEERYPTRVVPRLAAGDIAVVERETWVAELQRFVDRVASHTVSPATCALSSPLPNRHLTPLSRFSMVLHVSPFFPITASFVGCRRHMYLTHKGFC